MSDDGTPSVNPRKPIARRLRFEILRRDNYTCRYCGATAPDAVLTVDHVIPAVLGGGDEPNNLVTACKDCNAGKSSTSPDEHTVEDVDAAALLFARAMEQAAETRRADQAYESELIDHFLHKWDQWAVGVMAKPVPIASDWRASIATFMSRGLSIDDLVMFIRVAMESKASPPETWRYFCGCCWRELTSRTELARRLIEDGDV